MRVENFGMAAPSQVFVPVRAIGNKVVDNGGDTIAVCFTDTLAWQIAQLINSDAGAAHATGIPVYSTSLSQEGIKGIATVVGRKEFNE